MFPKTTKINVLERAVDVWYLKTRGECNRHENPDECGPVAAGMERKWFECAKHHEKAGKLEDSKSAREIAHKWANIADKHWPKACNDAVAALPLLGAFCVIPSSRENRRKSLVQALRARFPAAIELTYERPHGFHFGDKREDEIFRALKRTDSTILPKEAGVAVADDWAGGGTTLHAAIRRVLTDHGSCIGFVAGVVPGVSAVPLTMAR